MNNVAVKPEKLNTLSHAQLPKRADSPLRTINTVMPDTEPSLFSRKVGGALVTFGVIELSNATRVIPLCEQLQGFMLAHPQVRLYKNPVAICGSAIQFGIIGHIPTLDQEQTLQTAFNTWMRSYSGKPLGVRFWSAPEELGSGAL